MSDKMREAFEQEASVWSSNYSDKDESGNYRDRSVNAAWVTWQIAWQAALTEQPESEPVYQRLNRAGGGWDDIPKEDYDKVELWPGLHQLRILYTSPQPSAQVPEGFALVPEYRCADDVVTALYRRFKQWSEAGFGPDDVTWCEVKADIMALINETAPSIDRNDNDTE